MKLIAPEADHPAPEPTVAAVGGFDHNDTPYFNRELSWLAFNARVLQLAADHGVPLLERLKFLAIFASNLDEFFQVRVAGLKDQEAAGITTPTPDGRTPIQQLDEIGQVAARLGERHERIFLDDVLAALEGVGIVLRRWADLDESARAPLTELFTSRVLPVLTPLAVDPGHPFPYISDLSLNLAVLVRDPEVGRRHFARVKVPNLLPRFVALPADGAYILLEDLIAAHLDRLFPNMQVIEHHAFRVTRNADLTLEEEEADDLLEAVEMELRRRRFGKAIRLEVAATMSDDLCERLTQELDLRPDDVYRTEAPLDLTCLWQLASLDRPDLAFPSFSPLTDRELVDEGEPADLFAVLRRHDLMVHHPYTSFSSSVGEFIQQAATDPKVLAIKMTLYRTAGDSPIIDALVAAAESGKQVAVLVELKARFDEAANISRARRLEQAGVHVTYGLVGLKTHSKICLVVRDEPDGIRRYCHLGTGNYNHATARIYEDVGLLTADPDICADVATLVNALTGYGRGLRFERLLVAPETLRSGLVELIGREAAAERGRIVMKMNSLVDADIIDHLYEASRAGVQIDLIVRGICCLRPGVPGLSENIRVRSIVGRYLEHSRIYYFANGDGPDRPVYLIGSADLMERNLNRRVETVVRVERPRMQARLAQIFEVGLADDRLAWSLDGDGSWTRRQRPGGVESHVRFQELAQLRAGVHRPPAGVGTQGELVLAGGGLVAREGRLGTEVLLVHRPRYDDWTFPKGKVDPGEKVEDAAVREVAEETGYRCRLGAELGSLHYTDRHGRPKLVRYWAMSALDGSFTPNDEVDAIRWFSLDEARATLTYPQDTAIIDALERVR